MKKTACGYKFRFFIVFLLFLTAGQGFGQDFVRGAVLDAELYNRLPQKAALTTRAYAILPPRVSLKQYAPIPGDQTNYGTCVAWASAYAARTISESVALNRQFRIQATDNVFSPVYIYKNITDDPDCHSGTAIFSALDFMRDNGAAKMLDIERSTDFKKVTLSSFTSSRKYPIADYVVLYKKSDDEEKGPSHVQMVKKSLAEKKPVIIGMNTPNSFITAKEVWKPRENPGRYYGGHAMCVVGYDDEKNGGAFEVQNSWGKKWGDGGYIWIPYTAFSDWVLESYEIIENLAAFQEENRCGGFARIELYGSAAGADQFMGVELTGEAYYKTTSSYPSGTEFRFLLGNDFPSYVYAFAADLPADGDPSPAARIFPPPERPVSPILDYAESTIAWPGERQWIRMDEKVGTDYLVILYSKQAIPIDAVMARFAEARGAFPERVARAVGPNFVSTEKVSYEKNEIRFSAQSADSRSVFGLLLAIEHR